MNKGTKNMTVSVFATSLFPLLRPKESIGCALFLFFFFLFLLKWLVSYKTTSHHLTCKFTYATVLCNINITIYMVWSKTVGTFTLLICTFSSFFFLSFFFFFFFFSFFPSPFRGGLGGRDFLWMWWKWSYMCIVLYTSDWWLHAIMELYSWNVIIL